MLVISNHGWTLPRATSAIPSVKCRRLDCASPVCSRMIEFRNSQVGKVVPGSSLYYLRTAMWKRWGPGPVFNYESLLNARRWQVYAGRSIFVLVMLIGMTIVWFTKDNNTGLPKGVILPTYKQMAKLGEWFFYALAGIQISLVMLAAPAAAAGSVCMDKARGTLLHVLITDLSDTEVVLGKLGSRLAPVFGLIMCGVPVACLAALLGGIEFGAIAGCFVVSLSLAVLACTLALAISVWASKTHEVLMAVYMIFGFGLMALPIWGGLASSGKIMAPPAWFQKSNPYVLVLAPYAKPGFAGIADFAAFAGVAMALSAAIAILVIARLRKVVINQSSQPVKERRRRLPELARFFPSWPRPRLDGNPVLWREWCRNRPSRLARWLWAVLFVVIWGSMAWGTYESILEGTSQASEGFGFGFMMLFMFGLLMLSANCADCARGGAGARKPRRPAVDATFNEINPRREVVGHVPQGSRDGDCAALCEFFHRSYRARCPDLCIGSKISQACHAARQSGPRFRADLMRF